MNSLDLGTLLIIVIGFVTIFCTFMPFEEQAKRSFVIGEMRIPLIFEQRSRLMNFSNAIAKRNRMRNHKRSLYYRKHHH